MSKSFVRVVAAALAAGLVVPVTATIASPAVAADAPIPNPGRQDVMRAVDALPGLIKKMQRQTGVPGITAAVVYKDKLVYKGAFGVRDVDTDKKVTPSTVFQLASVSKPVGASAVAATIGKGVLNWDDPVAKYLPGFTLKDPWVGRHATVGDLYAHRSGLPGDAGNELEAYGFSRNTIIDRLRYVPLSPFRISYSYSNYGLTTAGEAAARAAGMSWDALAKKQIFTPLGMTKSSYSYDKFTKRSNTAALHQQIDGTWVQAETRDPHEQAPAGGLSSNVVDMAKWLRMELKLGRFEGDRVVKKSPLEKALSGQIRNSPANQPATPPQNYAYGMDVSSDSTGRMRWAHSGAFTSGAATRVLMIPELKVGLVVLTNGWPVGVPEAIGQSFADLVEYGSVQEDWLAALQPVFGPFTDATYEVNGTKKPKKPAPAKPLSQYVGTYANDYVGQVVVSERSGKLVVNVGPGGKTRLPLKHWDGDVFYYNSIEMPPGFYSGVTFSEMSGGRAGAVSLDEVSSGLGLAHRVVLD